MNQVDGRIQQMCGYYGMDPKRLRKYSDCVLKYYRMAAREDLETDFSGSMEEKRIRALCQIQYEHADDRNEVNRSLNYLSKIGVLDLLVDEAINSVQNNFDNEKEVFTDIYTKYYGERQNLSEKRLREITHYGRSQSYQIRSQALEVFGVYFETVLTKILKCQKQGRNGV